MIEHFKYWARCKFASLAWRYRQWLNGESLW